MSTRPTPPGGSGTGACDGRSGSPIAEGQNDLFNNPTLRQIAEAHSKTVAQVVLRWLTQRGVVAIPKSVRRARMQENFDVRSTDSGADEPITCGGTGTAARTYLDATFCGNGRNQRLLTVDNALALRVAGAQVPQPTSSWRR